MKLRLFCIFILLATSHLAKADSTDSEPQMRQDRVQSTEQQDFIEKLCLPVCLKIAEKDNAKLRNYFRTKCSEAYQSEQRRQTWQGKAEAVQENSKRFVKKCLPKAAYKAFVEPVKVIWDLFANLDKGIDIKEQLARCDQMPDCRRNLARYTLAYHQIDANDRYVVPDQKVDQEIKDIPIASLFRKSREGRNRLKNYCNVELRNASELIHLTQRHLSSYEKQKKIYDRVKQKNGVCPSLLEIPPPIDPKALVPASEAPLEKLDPYQQYEVGNTCLGEALDEFEDDFCAEVTSLGLFLPAGVIAKPVSRIGRSLKLARKSRMAKLMRDIEKHGLPTARPPGTVLTRQFVDRYNGRVFSSEAQNQKFISIANQGEQPNRFFYLEEHTKMKVLNDTTKDKDLVTAITNMRKEKTMAELRALKKKYPFLEIEDYNDFKATGKAISSRRSLSDSERQAIQKDLNAAFHRANGAFAEEVLQLGLDSQLGDPKTWFRAGIGNTIDEASLAARKARQFRDQVGVLDYNTSRVQGELKNRLKTIESGRLSMATSPKFSKLLSPDESGRLIPNSNVFDLVRKANDAEELATNVSKRFGINFSTDDAELLLTYSKGVDELSPPILVAKRETPQLDSPLGGLSADFLGLGASNLRGTAAGLAGRSEDLNGSIRNIRRQEQKVTEMFKRRKKRFAEIAKGNVICTGDDCVKALDKPLSYQEKVKLMSRVAADPDTRNVRMSFVAPNVPEQYQMALATHGESIEKALRKKLEGTIPRQKLENMTFGLDMQSVTVNQGQVDLIIGRSPKARLSRREQQKIDSVFREVLNSGYTYHPGATTLQVTTIRLVPNPNAALFEESENDED